MAIPPRPLTLVLAPHGRPAPLRAACPDGKGASMKASERECRIRLTWLRRESLGSKNKIPGATETHSNHAAICSPIRATALAPHKGVWASRSTEGRRCCIPVPGCSANRSLARTCSGSQTSISTVGVPVSMLYTMSRNSYSPAGRWDGIGNIICVSTGPSPIHRLVGA